MQTNSGKIIKESNPIFQKWYEPVPTQEQMDADDQKEFSRLALTKGVFVTLIHDGDTAEVYVYKGVTYNKFKVKIKYDTYKDWEILKYEALTDQQRRSLKRF